jgi:hypothetical protein
MQRSVHQPCVSKCQLLNVAATEFLGTPPPLPSRCAPLVPRATATCCPRSSTHQQFTNKQPTWHHSPALQHTLDHTQRVMQRPVHLIQVHVVGTTQQQRRCCRGLGAVDLDLWAARQDNLAAESFEVLRPVGCRGQVTNKHISYDT